MVPFMNTVEEIVTNEIGRKLSPALAKAGTGERRSWNGTHIRRAVIALQEKIKEIVYVEDMRTGTFHVLTDTPINEVSAERSRVSLR